MTTSITPTLPSQTVSADALTSASATTSTKSSPENTLSSIADALMGVTTSAIQRPQGQKRMFARIERLVDSLAKLIEAFASFKTATTPQSTSPGQVVDTQEKPLTKSTDQAPTQQPPIGESAPSIPPSDQATPMPTIDMTPSVDTEQPAQQPVAQPSPFELGRALGKMGGFLWKPVSDKNGDLVVLLPKQLTGRVQEVRVLSADGKKSLGKGKYSGIGNGDREHFRFSKSGGSYPDGAIVLIKLEDGSTRHVKISDTSKRLER